MGTIAALTEWEGDTESIVERYTYDAYGRLLVQTPGADGLLGTSDDDYSATSSVGNPYGFTARRLDTETGLMYYRARYYSPAQGRFVNRDPEEYVDGMNLYTAYFVPNGVDSMGQQQWRPRWEVVGGTFDKCLERCYNKFGIKSKFGKKETQRWKAFDVASTPTSIGGAKAMEYMGTRFAETAAASRSAAARTVAGQASKIAGTGAKVGSRALTGVGLAMWFVDVYDFWLTFYTCKVWCAEEICMFLD